MTERIRVEMKGGVADVRLVRADKMNALDDAMFSALIETGEQLKREAGVRAVVLSGEGRAFCAGLDTSNFAGMAGGRRSGGLVDTPRTPGGANRAQQAVIPDPVRSGSTRRPQATRALRRVGLVQPELIEIVVARHRLQWRRLVTGRNRPPRFQRGQLRRVRPGQQRRGQPRKSHPGNDLPPVQPQGFGRRLPFGDQPVWRRVIAHGATL